MRTDLRIAALEAHIEALASQVAALASQVAQLTPAAQPMAAAFIVDPPQHNTAGTGVIEPVYAHSRTGQPIPTEDAPPRGRMTITAP